MSDNSGQQYIANEDYSGGVDSRMPVEVGTTDLNEFCVLAGIYIKTSFISFQSLEPWPRKAVFGNASNEDDEYLTTVVYDNLNGGVGVRKMNETTDLNRFYYGSAMTRYPGIRKPYRVHEVPAVSGLPTGAFTAKFVGTIKSSGGQVLDVFANASSCWYGTIDTAMTNAGATIGAPTDAGVEFLGTSNTNRLIWPTGNGYSRLSDVLGFTNTLGAAGTVPNAISMCIFDNKLVALDDQGQLWYSVNISSPWELWVTGKIPGGQTPRMVRAGYDRSGQRCIYVITNKTIWQFVTDGLALIEIIDFSYPSSQYAGQAACSWNGDIYVAAGMNVMRYNGGAKQFVGLDRDDGLPDEFNGYITDLYPTDRGILATVRALTSAVWEYNGVGWNMVYAFPTGTVPVDRSGGSSTADQTDTWRFFFGEYPNRPKYIEYDSGSVQPRKTPGEEMYQPGKFDVVTSWYDNQLSGYLKVGNAIEYQIEEMYPTSVFSVYYQVDSESSDWIFLGRETNSGLGSMQLGDQVGDEARGVPYIRIRFRFVLEDYSYKTPYIVYVTFSSMKIAYPLMTFTIPLDYSRANSDLSPDDIHKVLLDAYTSPFFTTFIWKGEVFRGRISQYNGSGAPGMTELVSGSVSFLGVPEAIAKQWFLKQVR